MCKIILTCKFVTKNFYYSFEMEAEWLFWYKSVYALYTGVHTGALLSTIS